MNPAAFQSMGMAGPGAQAAAPTAGQPNNSTGMQNNIYRVLSQQQPLQGWQTTVPIQNRMMVVWQLVSSLRLLNPPTNDQQAVHIAISFETKAFQNCPDKHTYDRTYRQKLQEITETRKRQAAEAQQQMQNNQHQPVNMNQHQLQMQMAQRQGQSPFQHGPQNGQAAPMMHTQGMSISHQPMGRPQPQQFPLGHPQAAMPQAQLNTVQQMAQQMGQLSPEERQIITRMAQQLLQNTSQQNLENFQNSARNMSQEMKDSLNRQGMDPLTFVFRSQALKRYLNAQRGGQALGVPQGMGLMNGQPRPMPQNAMQNPGQLVAGAQGQQNFEPPFEQIIGQQRDGLRSQEAGQPVVPASSAQQTMGPRGMARPPTQQQQNVPTSGNHPIPNQNQNQTQPQQFWNTQQPSEIAQGNNMPGSTQPTNFGNATPVPNSVLTGQNFSLNDMSRTPSQNPPMPTLNKATAPPGPTQPPQNMWSQNRTTQMNNAHAPNLSMASQAPPQQGLSQEGIPQQPQQPQARPQPSLMNIPPQLRQQLVNMPEELRRNFLSQIQQRRRQVDPQQRGTQPQNFPPMPGPAIPHQQSVAQPISVNQPAFSQQVPLANPPGAQQQRQPQPGAQNQRPGQGPLSGLTEEQQKLMDKQKFPSGILNATSPLSQMPKDVETWGQLKAWVQQNASTLPQGSLNKLKSLQGIHYQSLSQAGPRHSAPEAQMVPHASGVAPQAANPSGMPSIPVPTAQELQNFRPHLPPQFKAATDEQLRAMIMRQKQVDMERARGLQGQFPAPVSQPKMPAPNGQPIPGPPRPNAAAAKPSAQKDQAVKQSPSTRSTAPTPKQPQPSKGVKRPSPDEVVEVSNSNRLQTQGPTAQPAPSGSSQAQDEQKARFDAQRSFPLQKPSVQPQMENQPKTAEPTEEMRRRDNRLKQLMAEVTSSLPPRKPVQMTAQQKESMAHKLQDMKQMVQRMEMSLPIYFRTVNDESSVITLIKTRNILKSQYQDGQGNPSDNFTISHEELDRLSNQLKQYFHFIMTRMSKSSAGGQQNQQVTQPQSQSTAQGKAPPLSAANLQEQQNRLQAARHATVNQQRYHAKQHGNQPPPAPTTAQPPFPLDPQSPRGQGVPIYGSHTLTRERLSLPPNPKRQRTTSIPPPAPGTPPTKSSPLATKPSSPEVQRTPAPVSTLAPSVTFSCPVTTCQASIKGFTTQAELDQHRIATHEPQEPVVEDPVGFALESMRQALGLDENGKSKPPKEKEQLEAPKMKISASAQSNAGVKTEVSTPLGRTLTQTGPSPSATLLKTPQTTNVKTPASEAKPSSGKDSKPKPSKEAAETPKDSAPSPFDPWSSSSVSPEAITSAWSSLTEMHNLSSFTKIQGVTPSSTLSSLENKSEKNSPHASDISENDAVKINIDVRGAGDATADADKSESWIPAEWFEDTLYGGIDSLNFDGDTMMQGMDWDIFGDESDTMMENVGGTGKGKGKANGASEEWLKVYAPERVGKS